MSEVRIAAEPRSEFGKGAARRTRRAGKVPAVLYGHGTDPQHITLPGHELMLALKTPNVLLRVSGLSGDDELALPKDVQRDPLKGFLEHVDLLLVKRGEKVTVDVPILLVGEVVAGGQLAQELTTVSLEAEATHIPSEITVDLATLAEGTSVLVKDLSLPRGATVAGDEDALVLQITGVQEVRTETDAEAAEAEAAAEAAAAEAPAAE
ncbi:50S ribosomal protein L25/general stress protein Ctc [Actinocorallia sp. A-T 12471]|uniref:50S ribosomal protein L25/general stress protein Ctc n=1 Tax=Actinocorallia sp. A-T 12471 TaxID=3089813 RepID=UPI0029D39DA3|nr:50S ribosomal protein L25/general stress protein Ctc [Actinocorallia sp. A-T 12471]MDX6738495.1 50S ribosomal protein L25/general stress protein Ctc [Actinocorallia sp. A-T 12471]